MKKRIILELEDIEKLIAEKYEIKSPLSINYTPLEFDGIYTQKESLEIEFTGKEKERTEA